MPRLFQGLLDENVIPDKPSRRANEIFSIPRNWILFSWNRDVTRSRVPDAASCGVRRLSPPPPVPPGVVKFIMPLRGGQE